MIHPIFFAFIFLFFISGNIISQDRVYLKTGETLNVKVLVVGLKEIEYKTNDSSSFQISEIKISKIDSIVARLSAVSPS